MRRAHDRRAGVGAGLGGVEAQPDQAAAPVVKAIGRGEACADRARSAPARRSASGRAARRTRPSGGSNGAHLADLAPERRGFRGVEPLAASEGSCSRALGAEGDRRRRAFEPQGGHGALGDAAARACARRRGQMGGAGDFVRRVQRPRPCSGMAASSARPGSSRVQAVSGLGMTLIVTSVSSARVPKEPATACTGRSR